MRQVHATLGLALAVLGCATPVAAQAPARPFTFWASAGTEVTSVRDDTRLTPGAALQFGIAYQRPASRLGFRLTGLYFARSDNRASGFSSSATTAALGLDALYELNQGGTRPYLVGGLGYARQSFAESPATVLRASLGTGYLGAGIGIQQQVGRARLFSEARYTIQTSANVYQRQMLPLTVGLRF